MSNKDFKFGDRVIVMDSIRGISKAIVIDGHIYEGMVEIKINSHSYTESAKPDDLYVSYDEAVKSLEAKKVTLRDIFDSGWI